MSFIKVRDPALFIFLLTAAFSKITVLANIESGNVSTGSFLKYHPFRAVTIAVTNLESAKWVGKELVKEKLAAVVNIFPQTVSIYSWKGAMQELDEVVMLIFTHETKYKNLEKYIRENHVHVEPGIVSLTITDGSASFFKWFEESLDIK